MTETTVDQPELRMRRLKIVGAVLLLVSFFVPMPDGNPRVNAALDALHVPVFAVAAFLVMRVFRKHVFYVQATLSLVTVMSVGYAIEVTQPYFGRRFSRGDLWADLWGTLLGILVFACVGVVNRNRS